MIEAVKKSVGMILIDVLYLIIIAFPHVRKTGLSVVMFGICLAIMTALSIIKNKREIENGGQEQEETPAMKKLYYIGIGFAMAGFVLAVVHRLITI